jgi:APA family basic amino acid/polyamine antiporter
MSPGDIEAGAEMCETKPAEQAAPGTKLQGELGWWYLYAMAFHSIIGPYLVMSYFWYTVAGPSIALSFFVTGCICIPIGLVYGELTAMFPKVGGSFMYIYKGFGREASYWVAWSLLLAYLALLAFMTNAFAQILGYFWLPSMGYWEIVIASLFILTVVFVLMSQTINIGALTNFVIWSMGMIIGIFWIILFLLSGHFNTANWQPFFANGNSGFITGCALMITMYFGFELIPQFAEECNYPHEKQWNIMFAAIVSAMAFYIAIVLTETGMLPMNTIINTMPNFVSAIEARQFYGDWLAVLIGFANICVLLGCIIGFYLGSARVMYSMSRDKVFPTIFLRLNKKNQPIVANILIYLVAVFFILSSGTTWLANLYNMMAIGIAITYTCTCAAFIRMRYTLPDHPRPWRTPGGLATGIIATIAGIIIVYWVLEFFTTDMWTLFILYFVIGFIIRLILWWDERAHPETFVKEAMADKI